MKSDKDLYRQLRVLPCERLWGDEVAKFDKASPKVRMERVAVIRAVGVVFSASGTAAQRAEVRAWLVRLLRDPSEKIRRYAMAALPKIGAGPKEEKELLTLLRTSDAPRERQSVGRTLDKIGGPATLEAADGIAPQTEQKVKASVARSQDPSSIRMDGAYSRYAGLRIHLRCRKGLESIVRDEFNERIGPRGKFRIVEVGKRFVAISPKAPFSLTDIYALRCFGTLSFVLGFFKGVDRDSFVETVATAITSPLSRRLLSTFTEGSVRYRLDFVDKGHQRGAVRLVANRAYALCPDILNDPRSAPWSVDVHESPRGISVELRPRLTPDPRFYYRKDDVDASSHPPLAACMARLAGRVPDEIVWDPFCGSGQELIEFALLGSVTKIYGTDSSPEAIAIAQANVEAAKLDSVQSKFIHCDFREHAKVDGLGLGSVTLMITNPPMGRRIRVPNMQGLFADLFAVAATVLKPGGRLVFANPLRCEPKDPSLKLQYRQSIDLGGFDCRLEVYLKS